MQREASVSPNCCKSQLIGPPARRVPEGAGEGTRSVDVDLALK